MTNSALAHDYAKVFYSVLEESGKVEKILYQIKQLQKLNDTQAYSFLMMPTISFDKKMVILDSLTELEVEQEIINLIKILLQNKDFDHFGEIMREYQNIFQEKENIQIVNITVADPLTGEQLDNLVKGLESKLNKMVVVLSEVDKSVIGGIKIEYNSKELDNTIKRYLRDFINQF